MRFLESGRSNHLNVYYTEVNLRNTDNAHEAYVGQRNERTVPVVLIFVFVTVQLGTAGAKTPFPSVENREFHW